MLESEQLKRATLDDDVNTQGNKDKRHIEAGLAFG
jgi:hypothetical protein